jgi:choline dehydrogenase-like flavoprotein
MEVDAVVVGTGAGGAIALRELARAGLDVVGFEEGAHLTAVDFDQREDRMLSALYQDHGARATDDMAIRVLQGRGIGGSTVHNTNLCKRPSDVILDLWARKYAVAGAGPADMRPAFEAIERDLSVSEIDPSMRNANNDVLRAGCEALGWQGGPLKHNRVGCTQSGFCELGCRYDAKQNALKVILPQAVQAGARIYSDVEIETIVHDGREAVGVRGKILGADGKPKGTAEVRARVVVLAASAVGSAALGRRSNLPDPYARLGRGLHLHPGAIVAARFEREIAGWLGIPQSYECTELLSHEEGSEKRVWIVPAFAHPIGAAATIPGFGAPHMAAMRRYRNLAVLTAMLHDETSGEVALGPENEPVIRYSMIESDRLQLASGLIACAKLLLAAGASDVTIPAVPPIHVSSAAELAAVDLSALRPHSVPLTAVHPMGTMAMGEDPRSSVVRSTGEHHQLRNLFVADGSLFPTSLGGPPQIGIYGFALHLSRHVVERARGG